MKYQEQLKRVVVFEREALEPEIRALLDSDPAFREEFEALRRTRQLISLKRYEAPDPYVATRVSARVREALAAQPAPAAEVAWLPRLTYGVAALAVGVVGLYFAAPARIQVGSQEIPDPVYGVARQEAAPLSDPAPSNAAPRGVQYGPAPSSLVEYEF